MNSDHKSLEERQSGKDMELPIRPRAKDEGFWRELWFQVRLVWHLIRSPEVPLYLKILPVLALIYVMIPTDFMPDIFPFIGQLDDLTAILVGAKVFIELSPQDVVERQRQEMRRGGAVTPEGNHGDSGATTDEGVIIDGEYEITDEI